MQEPKYPSKLISFQMLFGIQFEKNGKNVSMANVKQSGENATLFI
jgi:hypothetical protein